MPRAAKKNEPAQETSKIDDLLLSEIHEATQGAEPTNYLFVDTAEVGPLTNAGYVVTNPNITDASGKIAAKITNAGTQWLRENAPNLIAGPVYEDEDEDEDEDEEDTATQNQTETVTMNQAETQTASTAAAKRAKPVISGIVSNVNLAAAVAKRGGARPETYPFSQLEVNQAFFIPATEEVPDPVKSYASTVASATNRYAEEVPGETRETRKGNVVPKTKPTRVFRIVRVANGADFGPEFQGKPGAAVQRVQ